MIRIGTCYSEGFTYETIILATDNFAKIKVSFYFFNNYKILKTILKIQYFIHKLSILYIHKYFIHFFY